MSGNIYGGDTRWRDLFLFVLAVTPFYLNDFVFIATETAPQWLAADFAFRFLGLMIIFVILPLRECVRNSFAPLRNLYEPLPMTAIRIGSMILLCFLGMVVIEYYVRIPLYYQFPDSHFFSYPEIENSLLYGLDITFGLALTAISEEFAFRAIAKKIISKFSNRTPVILIASSIIFAFIHWSHGIPNVTSNFISGIIFMALFLRTRSIVPPIILHYAVNVWSFA